MILIGGLAILVAAAVMGVLFIVNILEPKGVSWLRRETDGEQLAGLLILLGFTASLVVTVVMICRDGDSPVLRVTVSVVAVTIALSAASTNWTRRSLRWAGLLTLLCLGLLVVDIGRDGLEREPVKKAAAELDVAKVSLDGLEPRLTAAQADISKRKTETIAALETAITGVGAADPGLVSAAEGLRVRLTAGAGRPERDVELARFDAAYRPAGASTSEARLRQAVDAAVAAAGAERPVRLPADTALSAACVVTTGLKAPPAEFRCDDQGPTGETLAVTMARARFAVAAYREAVLGRDEDKAATKTRRAELDKAEAVAAGMGTPKEVNGSPASVVDALRKGGELVVAGIPGQHNRVPLTVESGGWTLLAVVALAFWRLVERRSGQQMAGPITSIDFNADEPPKPGTAPPAAAITGAPKDAAKAVAVDSQKVVFRTALLKNLPERAAAPGAEAATSITDLAELVGAGGPISRVLTALKRTITMPGGYIVTGDSIAPVGANGHWQVLVRISDRLTGEQVAVRTLSGTDATTACRSAGYWAAATILSRSTRIPSWAWWDEDSAESLGLYDNPEAVPTENLLQALTMAPISGALLHEVADRRELEGKHLDALMLYTRAVAAHPRFPTARYRMAVSVALVADPAHDQWMSAPLSERKRLTEQLIRACATLHLDTAKLKAPDGEVKDLATLPAAVEADARTCTECAGPGPVRSPRGGCRDPATAVADAAPP